MQIAGKANLPLLAQMLDRARHFVPALATLNIIRCWSGLRAASQDGSPLIGPHPTRRGVLTALGHEGLGVTTAPDLANCWRRRSSMNAAHWRPTSGSGPFVSTGGDCMKATLTITIDGEALTVPEALAWRRRWR